MRKEIIIKGVDKMERFKKKVKELNNEELYNELIELYKVDAEKAEEKYMLEYAKKILKEKNSLFKRLSDM